MNKEYVIRYKLFDNEWSYFTKLVLNSKGEGTYSQLVLNSKGEGTYSLGGAKTYSVYGSGSKEIMKMTLEVAEEYIEHIKKIKGEFKTMRSEIQILNIETNEIVNLEQIKADKEFLSREPISIFELMDFEE